MMLIMWHATPFSSTEEFGVYSDIPRVHKRMTAFLNITFGIASSHNFVQIGEKLK